jgi:uncharacterized protein (TIGR02246 family)
MRTNNLLTLAIILLLISQGSTVIANQEDDEATIRQNAAEYVKAFNRRDARALAAFWSPEAIYMNPSSGEEVVGRSAIEKQFAGNFAESGGVTLAVDVESVQFVSPNVAVEEGLARVMSPNSEPEESHYTAIHVKRNGQWLLDRVSEGDAEDQYDAPPPSNYEHLKELEWMIGSWIDQDDAATVQTDCEWTKNQNFMTRSFAVVIGDQVNMAGMQIIGWDPSAKQIRSWVFDSNGGFSEGTWTRKDNRWIIQSHGTLPDGGKSSATNVLKYVNDDSFTWQSINREVDGELLPNVDEVMVIRKPVE